MRNVNLKKKKTIFSHLNFLGNGHFDIKKATLGGSNLDFLKLSFPKFQTAHFFVFLRYINTVNNRIQACNGAVYSRVKPASSTTSTTSTPSPPVQSSLIIIPSPSTTPPTPSVSVTQSTEAVQSATVNQITLTPEVSVMPASNVNAPKPQKWPGVQIKTVKKNSKPPMPGLKPIEKPVEIISSPEISLYNIPSDGPKRMRMSPTQEILPDVSISKTVMPKVKSSISSSIPISQSNPTSTPNTSQANVVFFLPPNPGGVPIVLSQASNVYDQKRQSFTTKISSAPRVSKAATPPHLVISQVRSLAPSMSNVRPRRTSNEMRFPGVPTSGEQFLLAAFPTLVNNNITVRPNPNPAPPKPVQNIPNVQPTRSVPNYMLFPSPRSIAPSMSTSITPPVSLLGGQARSLSGSQVANRNDKNLIRTLLNARPNLQTNFQGNKSEP